MISHTKGEIIIVADHSKWGVVSNFEVARIDEIHTLVTDDKLSAQARNELAVRNVRVIVAGAASDSNSPTGG